MAQKITEIYFSFIFTNTNFIMFLTGLILAFNALK